MIPGAPIMTRGDAVVIGAVIGLTTVCAWVAYLIRDRERWP